MVRWGRTGSKAGKTIPGGGAGWHAEALLPEALATLSELQWRRGWWLWLRLNERNTLMALHTQDSKRLGIYGRFTEWTKTKLKGMAVSSDCQLQRTVVMNSTCCGSSCGSVSLVAPSLQRFSISFSS